MKVNLHQLDKASDDMKEIAIKMEFVNDELKCLLMDFDETIGIRTELKRLSDTLFETHQKTSLLSMILKRASESYRITEKRVENYRAENFIGLRHFWGVERLGTVFENVVLRRPMQNKQKNSEEVVSLIRKYIKK